MNQLFFVDPSNNEEITWNNFLLDLNEVTSLPTIIDEVNYYQFIQQLVISLTADIPITIIDGTYTATEKAMIYSHVGNTVNTVPIQIGYNSISQLISNLNKPKINWSITLFSSGTTGQPKMVKHTWETLTRTLKLSGKHLHNVWGLAYNPAHIAGIQVILQALLNQNTLVRLFGLSPYIICAALDKYKITHISATSSFYRLLLPIDQVMPYIKRVTFGGEKLDSDVKIALQKCFPYAKFLNLYASTEAGTLLSSDGEFFSIPEIYKQLIKIMDDTLWIHQSLMPSLNSEDLWFNTGDIVEVLQQDPLRFKFVKRATDVVNIGGYNVNLEEVKNAILTLKNITKVRLFTKQSKLMGNVLLCDIQTEDEDWTEQKVRIELSQVLTEYKIPRVFNFYSTLPLSRTGKGE